jgi:hypothetical protein
MSIISALGRLRQEDHEFEASPGYIITWACLKILKKGGTLPVLVFT